MLILVKIGTGLVASFSCMFVINNHRSPVRIFKQGRYFKMLFPVFPNSFKANFSKGTQFDQFDLFLFSEYNSNFGAAVGFPKILADLISRFSDI